MFCNSCGSKLKESDKFCENCGASIEGTPKDDNFHQQPPQHQSYQQPPQQQPQQQYSGPYQQPTVVYQPSPVSQRKSPGIAVVLSIFVLLGSGQMYGGKVGRGLGFLFGVYGLTIFSIIAGVVFWWGGALYFIPVIAGLHIWCHIDASRVVEKYNSFLYTHKRPPTNIDNW